jgi:hypothetical protein
MAPKDHYHAGKRGRSYHDRPRTLVCLLKNLSRRPWCCRYICNQSVSVRRQEVEKAYAEYFKQVRPTATMVEVSRLINPEILVEIELDAISLQLP